MENAVSQLQLDNTDYRKELRPGGRQGPANPLRPTKRSGFTSTPVPRYSGKSSWEQYRQVFAAIVCSNGWDEATAALQLLSHLDGDALNVDLLMPESLRVVPGVLMNSLSEHYGSPGRYKLQVQASVQTGFPSSGGRSVDLHYRAGDVCLEGVCGYRLLDPVRDGVESVH